MADYVEPQVHQKAYHCPHCGVHSHQLWSQLHHLSIFIPNFDVGRCSHCDIITLWNDKKMVFPLTGNAPPPNSDMPENIKKDYLEACDIVSRSPRSARGLLRLCAEKICNEQEVEGKDLNEKIGNLVKIGSDPEITHNLDVIRVMGNQAVHPSDTSLDDDAETTSKLFKLINLISLWAYTNKKMSDELFGDLSDGQKEAIKKRDEKNTK